MPIAFDQIAPLLKGSYTTDDAAWEAMESAVIPMARAALGRLWRPGLAVSRDDFAMEVLAELGRAVIEKRGRTEPPPPPPTDYTAWLRTVVLNFARDVLRKHERQQKHIDAQEFDDTRSYAAPTIEDTTTTGDTSEAARRAAMIVAELTASSPLYVIALYAWTDPRAIRRPLLEAAAQVPTRGRTTTTTGLARSVDDTLALLAAHRAEIATGASRDAKVCERLAWIFRSATPDFAAWRQDRRVVTAARETLAKWFQRARQKLGEHRQRHRGEDA